MAVATPAPLFDELIDFLASAPGLEHIVAFQPSEALQQRSHYLLERNRQNLLTAEQRTELEQFMTMNHLVNMLNIRAKQRCSYQGFQDAPLGIAQIATVGFASHALLPLSGTHFSLSRPTINC